MDTKKMRSCAPLLPEPGDKVVCECLDEIERLRGHAAKALEILNTARCTTNRAALFDLIVQATGPLMPNVKVRGAALLRRPSRP